MIKKILFRYFRILSGKKGIYGILGKMNHFSNGDLIYENAVIGNNNYFSPYVLMNNCKLGNFCSIGPGCKLGLGEHDLHAISTYPAIGNGVKNIQLFNPDKPTVIDCDVWLGANVVVKQGVHIETGAVIGAGAVVTHDIPAYAIAVGVPARIHGYRFTEEKIKTLLDSRWYDCGYGEARIKVQELTKIL